MRRYLLLALLAGVFAAGAAQQRTIVAGLEGNAEYRGLVESERALAASADSVAGLIAGARGRLRTDTLDRASLSARIVALEEQGFALRSRMGGIAARINTIEQEWILQNLMSSPGPAEQERVEEPVRNHRNLVYSSWFERGLSTGQLAELRAAQRGEGDVPPLVGELMRGRELEQSLAGEYDRAATQVAADSIRTLFEARAAAGRELAADLGERWGAIFDAKSYLYNLAADRLDRSDLMALFESGMERLREEQSQLSAATPAVEYALQKRMLTAFEIALAGDMGNDAAADSLGRAAAAIPDPAALAALTPVTIRERLFINYADVAIGNSPYNASNPIPEVEVWPRGVIWRVSVGSFASAQGVSIFRHAHPLAVERTDDGRYRYYAGGFATDSLATAAVERMRRAGFRSPSPVVWADGVYIDPAADGGERKYRIEIGGADELDPATRQTIASTTQDPEGHTAEIVRAGEIFIVGPLDAPAAIRLRSALEAAAGPGSEMSIRLTKITG